MSKASICEDLSAVDYDIKNKYFYISVDKLLFQNPVTTIKSVLDAHGFVTNLENILSCLDSCVFSINARVGSSDIDESSVANVKEYMPCVQFELPQKDKVGETLQSFYDEIASYESKIQSKQKINQLLGSNTGPSKDQSKELERIKMDNEALKNQVNELSVQLLEEKKSNTRMADSQESLPGNTKICRVHHIDLKRRTVKVKSVRKLIDIPTHMLDRVPDFKARCLITFDDDGVTPLGILFFDTQERDGIEKRVADLLYVENDTFKARDSLRNEFQIKSLNPAESETIQELTRGMKILISIADGYVVRFSVLGAADERQFSGTIREQLAVYEIGRNQLVSADENLILRGNNLKDSDLGKETKK